MTTRELALRKRIEAMIDNYVPQNNEGWTKPITSSYRAGAHSLLPLLLELAEALEKEIPDWLICAHDMEPNTTMDYFRCEGCGARSISVKALSSLDRFLSGGEK